jgi:hypothetical protein
LKQCPDDECRSIVNRLKKVTTDIETGSGKKPTPAPSDATAGLTGKAAQQALQDHIMKSGTGDVKKIDRLRRASLQPDSKGPSAQKAQDDAAAMMAAAMAEIDDEEEEEDEVAEQPQSQTDSGSVAVTFTEEHPDVSSVLRMENAIRR